MALVTVPRIVRGYPFAHRLLFRSPSGGAPAMADLTAATRITASLRPASRPELAPIATLDTAAGTLQAIDPATLRLAIPATVTALLPLAGVLIHLDRLDAGAWSALPVFFPAWPVRAGVPS